MPGSLEVRARPGAPSVRKTLTGVITAVTSVLFIAGGSAHPAGFGGILFILLGVAGLGLCVAGALVFTGQVTGRRPVLELDDQGIRVPAVWPRSRRADRLLPWSDVAAVCAWSQGPPSGGRAGTVFPHRLAFLPASDSPASDSPASDSPAFDSSGAGSSIEGPRVRSSAGRRATVGSSTAGSSADGPAAGRERRTPPENGAELLAIKVADVACVPTLRWSVQVRPGWDTTVEEIAKAVQDRRSDVPFIDRRDLPRSGKKRKPPARKPAADRPAISNEP